MSRICFDVFVPGHLDHGTATRAVLLAEELGYNCAWTEDHLLGVLGECWTRLAAWAAVTQRVRLGSLVSCAFYRSPILLAGICSTVDSVSKGRVELGLGAGYWQAEFRALGTEFFPYETRLQAFEELVVILKGLLRKGGRFSYKGKFFSVGNQGLLFQSVQRPHPPITIGCKASPMLEIVARQSTHCSFADTTFTEVRTLLKKLRAKCQLEKTPYSEIQKSCFFPWVFVSTSSRETRRRMKKLGQYITRQEPGWKWSFTLSGHYEACLDQIRDYVDAGISRFMIGFAPDSERVDPLGSKWELESNMTLFRDLVIRKIV